MPGLHVVSLLEPVETPAQHAQLIAQVASAGPNPIVVCVHTGRRMRVVGTSRWDEGLCVSREVAGSPRVVMHTSRVERLEACEAFDAAEDAHIYAYEVLDARSSEHLPDSIDARAAIDTVTPGVRIPLPDGSYLVREVTTWPELAAAVLPASKWWDAADEDARRDVLTRWNALQGLS
jgi:hypothetical protein